MEAHKLLNWLRKTHARGGHFKLAGGGSGHERVSMRHECFECFLVCCRKAFGKKEGEMAQMGRKREGREAIAEHRLACSVIW